MLIKIGTCPKCLKKTLIMAATSSCISKKCQCGFNESMLVADARKEKVAR